MHSWVGVSRNWKQNFRTKSWWVPWTQKWHFHVWVWLSACLLGCGFMEWLSYHQKQADVLECCLFLGFPCAVPCLVVFLHPSFMMCYVLWLLTVVWQGLENDAFMYTTLVLVEEPVVKRGAQCQTSVCCEQIHLTLPMSKIPIDIRIADKKTSFTK